MTDLKNITRSARRRATLAFADHARRIERLAGRREEIYAEIQRQARTGEGVAAYMFQAWADTNARIEALAFRPTNEES